LEEKFSVAAKPKASCGMNRREQAGRVDEVELTVGMNVMVTSNVSTDLAIANGARGNTVEIVLDVREEIKSKCKKGISKCSL